MFFCKIYFLLCFMIPFFSKIVFFRCWHVSFGFFFVFCASTTLKIRKIIKFFFFFGANYVVFLCFNNVIVRLFFYLQQNIWDHQAFFASFTKCSCFFFLFSFLCCWNSILSLFFNLCLVFNNVFLFFLCNVVKVLVLHFFAYQLLWYYGVFYVLMLLMFLP